MADLSSLEQGLGVSFKDQALLVQALVHGSFVNENPGFLSNERLEFLGDAVLGLVVAEKLHQELTSAGEGELTKRRAAVVSREALTGVAKAINLGEYLYLGKGEAAEGGRLKPANLAGALEAVIAAVYLDDGFNAASHLVLRLFREEIERALGMEKGDYKSQLQELIQAKGQGAPTYHVIQEIGPAHDKTFVVEVRGGEVVLGIGSGKSKKTAEMEAAWGALLKFRAFTG